MSCQSCGPSPNSLEYTRRRKPENNNGCGCSSSVNNDCDSPSLAAEGSALYIWEQKYGKLITTIKDGHDENGKKIKIIEKKPCPKKLKNPDFGCCSLRYKVTK